MWNRTRALSPLPEPGLGRTSRGGSRSPAETSSSTECSWTNHSTRDVHASRPAASEGLRFKDPANNSLRRPHYAPRGRQKQIYHGAKEHEIPGPAEHSPPGADRSPGRTVTVTVTGIRACKVSSAGTLAAQPLRSLPRWVAPEWPRALSGSAQDEPGSETPELGGRDVLTTV